MTSFERIAALLLAGVVTLPLGAGEQAATTREARGATRAPSAADAIAAAMNPFVLTNLVSDHLVLEVDWVEGRRPSPKALAAAEAVLREHCESGKRIEVLEGDEIPRLTWEAHSGREGLERLAARFLDGDPSAWERTELVWVLYVPDGRSWYEGPLSGMTDRVTFSRSGRIAGVRTVLLFTDEIRRDATLWITPSKVERATLVHELGHVLGLVANPDHEQPGHRGHCGAARCVMHRPGRRAAWVNGLPAFFAGRIPRRFAARCVQDIETAKRVWSERAARTPGFARSLKAQRLLREKHDGEAWRASRDVR